MDLRDKSQFIKTKPKIISADNINATDVHLKWKGSSDAQRYRVQRRANTSDDFKDVAWTLGNELEYTDYDLEEETIYQYRIVAWKKIADATPAMKKSAVVSVILSNIPIPEILSVEEIDNLKIEIKWKKNEEYDGYIIDRRHDFMTTGRPIAALPNSQDSYVDSSIVKGQLYYYSIQYVKKFGDMDKGGRQSKELSTICLDKSKILSAKNKFGRKVELSLRLTSGAGGYIIERSDFEDGNFKQVGKTKGNTSIHFQDKIPKRFKKYFYRVQTFRTVDDATYYGEVSEVVMVKYK